MSGHGVRSVTTRRPEVSHGIAGFGVLKLRLGGISACRSASTALITPATPAPASRWPTLGLTEPIRHGWSAGRPAPSTAVMAPASSGSPTRVPVPCAST